MTTGPSQPHPQTLVVGRIYTTALIGLGALALLLGFVRFSGFSAAGSKNANLTDFHTFYAVSELIRKGLFAKAYDFAFLHQFEQKFGASSAVLAWLYPPPFGLVVAPLSMLPLAVAYLAFAGATLIAYVAVLRRLAGPAYVGVALMILPCLMLNLATGQNGLLTGALVGAFAAIWLSGAPWAGVLLGLMIVKPHLAVGLGLLFLLRREWRTVGVSLAAAAAACALATAAFGAASWSACLKEARETPLLLGQGVYPFFRMTSIYASLRSLGVASDAASVAQTVSILTGLALTFAAAFRVSSRRIQLALAILATPLFSPYFYDYDLAVIGVALALLAGDLAVEASRGELVAAAFFSTLATACGLASSTALVLQYGPAGPTHANPEATVGAFFYFGFVATILWILRAHLRIGRRLNPPPSSLRHCAPASPA